MNRNSILVIFFTLFITVNLFSDTLEVNQNGSTPYTIIQSAINNSQNGDIVLVNPGIYYENLNFNGKNIALTSLYPYNLDETFIHQTIIDGNHIDSVIIIESGENAEIMGFTIRNGRVDHEDRVEGVGGGIKLDNSNLYLANVVIKENIANGGGGIRLDNSTLDMYSCTIKNNTARYGGGGISSSSSEIIFQENHRSNIYNNYSCYAADIYLANCPLPTIIYADTLTVDAPDRFYINAITGGNTHTSIPIYQYNYKIEAIDNDIYVSPIGNDNNSGLSTSSPFKTIRKALMCTKPNPDNPHTIHLLPGTYSQSVNEEYYPLTLRDFTTISGVNREEVILDGESNYMHFCDRYSVNSGLSNMTLNNGYANFIASSIYKDNNFAVEENTFQMNNVVVCNSNQDSTQALHLGGLDIGLHNCVFENNNSIGILANYTNRQVKRVISNCRFSYNNGGLFVRGNSSAATPDSIIVLNSLFNNNFKHGYSWDYGVISLSITKNVEATIANCTFADNIPDLEENGSAIHVTENEARVDIINSIFYRSTPCQIYLGSSLQISSSITNSLVKNGESGIYDHYSTLIYENNLDQIPKFSGENTIYPFTLSSESPCIDFGSTDLPDWLALPEIDLAGNPRISGNTVDIGCYEYTLFATPAELFMDEGTGIFFWEPPVDEYPESYSLYLNGELITTINHEVLHYDFSELVEENSTYNAGVSAVYSGGQSDIMLVEFTYNPVLTEDIDIPTVKSQVICYPNPFSMNGSTRKTNITIDLLLSNSGIVDVSVYNIKGQKVTNLIDSDTVKGTIELSWNGKDFSGRSVSSGIYLIKCELNGKIIDSTKLSIVK